MHVSRVQSVLKKQLNLFIQALNVFGFATTLNREVAVFSVLFQTDINKVLEDVEFGTLIREM